jgi:hypothetical protein
MQLYFGRVIEKAAQELPSGSARMFVNQQLAKGGGDVLK